VIAHTGKPLPKRASALARRVLGQPR
jgi:hypothetical protein